MYQLEKLLNNRILRVKSVKRCRAERIAGQFEPHRHRVLFPDDRRGIARSSCPLPAEFLPPTAKPEIPTKLPLAGLYLTRSPSELLAGRLPPGLGDMLLFCTYFPLWCLRRPPGIPRNHGRIAPLPSTSRSFLRRESPSLPRRWTM